MKLARLRRTLICVSIVALGMNMAIGCDDGGGGDCSDGPCNAMCLDNGHVGGGYCDGDHCRCVDDTESCEGLSCDDGVECTDDRCSDGACRNTPNDDLCADGEVCNQVAGCIDDDPNDPRASISVEIEYPSIIDRVFPTYISHLIGSPNIEGAVLVYLTITNRSSTASFNVRAESSLLDYSSSAPQTLSLGPGETTGIGVSPSFDLDALFELTAARPGIVQSVVTVDGMTIWEDSYSVTIANRNSAFMSDDYFGFLSVFSTPHDQNGYINELLRDAADLTPWGSMPGYQGTSIQESEILEPGYSIYYQEFFAVDETVTITFHSVSGRGSFFVVDLENLEIFLSGSTEFRVACQRNSPSSGTEVNCGPLSPGYYYSTYFNTSENTNFSYQASRTQTREEIVRFQMDAIYSALQDRGMTYVNAPADFLNQPTQTIYYPAETYRTTGANCIDGTILFAAALESLGMRPYIVLVPGHAYLAVQRWPDVPDVLALETTMVGDSPFWDAYDIGNQRFGDEYDNPGTKLIDIFAARQVGILPAPM